MKILHEKVFCLALGSESRKMASHGEAKKERKKGGINA